jgi:hypothetical protein
MNDERMRLAESCLLLNERGIITAFKLFKSLSKSQIWNDAKVEEARSKSIKFARRGKVKSAGESISHIYFGYIYGLLQRDELLEWINDTVSKIVEVNRENGIDISMDEAREMAESSSKSSKENLKKLDERLRKIITVLTEVKNEIAKHDSTFNYSNLRSNVLEIFNNVNSFNDDIETTRGLFIGKLNKTEKKI